MRKVEVKWSNVIDSPWLDMEPIHIGIVPCGEGTPDQYIQISVDGQPYLCVHMYVVYGAGRFFQEAILWQRFLVIGWCESLYLVDVDALKVETINLDFYFGHLYAFESYLLVASGERLMSISVDGSIQWRSERVGIDGVILNRVENGFIYGEGEWDPPGGWRAYRISLDTGKYA